MQMQQAKRNYLAALGALASCSLTVFAGEGNDKKDALKPLPPQIAKVWRDAGAKVGWMQFPKDFEYYVFDEVRFVPGEMAPDGELPGFRYGTPSQVPLNKQPPWKAGVLINLPDPGVP